jgi:hypothetical protein
MRPTFGVLALLVLAAMAPAASAQGPQATSLALSGAGPVLDLTDTATRNVNIQVQFEVDQGFTCTGAAEITVDLAVVTNGPITASLNNATATYTIPQAHAPIQPFKGDAFTVLTVTKTAAHPEAEAVVTATYAGGSVSGCIPGEFAASNASITVRTTALGAGPAAPNLTIASPKANAEDSEFAMVVSVINYDLKPVGTSPGKVAGQGHIHYLVDGKPAEGDYATPNKSFTFKNLAVGTRVLRAELVNNDHTPLSPPVFQEVTVKAVAAGAKPTPTTPGATPATPTGSGGTPVGEGDGGEEEDKSFLPGPGVFALAAALGAAALVLRRRKA